MGLFGVIAYAQEATGAAGAAGGAQASSLMGTVVSLLPMVLVIVLLYFMMIRPQRKRDKEMKAMISALKVGDKVVTIGGIVGKIAKIKDEYVTIETGSVGNPNEKSFIRMERSSIKEVEAKEQA